MLKSYLSDVHDTSRHICVLSCKAYSYLGLPLGHMLSYCVHVDWWKTVEVEGYARSALVS